METKKVLIILTNDCSRETLAKIINRTEGFTASCLDNELNLEGIKGNDIIILDPYPFYMTDQLDTAMCQFIDSGAKLVVLDSGNNRQRMVSFKTNISAYLEMPEDPQRILKAIKEAAG